MKIKSSSGYIEDFDEKKIMDAITKDTEFTKKMGKTTGMDIVKAKKIATKVSNNLKKVFDDEDIVSSDTIRGYVTTELRKIGEHDLASISEIVGMRSSEIYGIINGSDDHDNANLKASPETSHKLIADKISKTYIERILPEHLVIPHIKGDYHIHNEEYFATRPFCRSWDLRPFFMYGFSPEGKVGATIAGPAKHAHVAILQACKVLAMGQTQHSGGQGLLHGTVFLAPYMEGKPYKEIYQLMQLLMYELNQMFISRGGQVIFSSINVNPGVPKILENVKAVRAGKILDKTYGDFEREVRLQFQALMEISLEGDYTGSMMPFPKIEVAIEKKFINPKTWDFELKQTTTETRINRQHQTYPHYNHKTVASSYKKLYHLAFQAVSKFGSIYFDNMLPEDRHAETTMGCTQCCSYQFKDSSESNENFDKALNFQDGYHFQLGGMEVISINLPRLAYSSENEKKLIANIYNMMDKAVEVFKIKKQYIINAKDRLRFINQTPEGGQPYVNLDSLVYEIGIVGLNEMVQVMTGYQLHKSKEAIDFAKRILQQMGEYCKLLTEFQGLKVVLSRTPAETVSQKFAVCDILDEETREKAIGVVRGDVESAQKLCKSGNRNLPIYYSNGFAPAVDADISIFEKIKIENEFWPLVDGGAVTHIWLGEDNPEPDGLMEFAFNIFKNTNIGYLTFTKNMSQCVKCKQMINGLVYKCDKCGHDELEWYSRITGYYSVVGVVKQGKLHERWGANKIEELSRRKRISIC